jgi:beta-lactamase superfamily II metal-dependent hydrolase
MFKITMFPADEGDSFFVETGEPPSTHRMLIDGGRLRTAKDILKPFIRNLPPRVGPAIDLVILTHIDLDHIEGLLSLLTGTNPPTIGEIWFNDYPQVRAASGKRPLPTSRPLPGQTSEVEVLGMAQAKTLAEAVERNRWPLNAKFLGGPVLVEASGNLPTVDLTSGAALTLLGPTRSKLAAFEGEWKKELAKLEQKQLEVLRERVRPIPTPGQVEGIALQRNEPDTRKPNGTSIAFVVQYKSQRALFLADSHPDDMAHNVARYHGAAGRASFNVVKVSHHGSAGNNTSQLIDLLESPLWLVSSSGSYHQHPDPEAISRIVLAPVRGKQLIFNYRSSFNEAWDAKPLSEHYGYTPLYATIDKPFSVDLMNVSTAE